MTIGHLTRKSRATSASDAYHTYLWNDIPRDVWNAADKKRQLDEIPSMKALLEKLLRKYARRPYRKPRKSRNPLKLF